MEGLYSKVSREGQPDDMKRSLVNSYNVRDRCDQRTYDFTISRLETFPGEGGKNGKYQARVCVKSGKQ